MSGIWQKLVGLTSIVIVVGSAIASDEFEQSIHPILRNYCNTCHSTEKLEGELDLQRFDSTHIVKQHI